MQHSITAEKLTDGRGGYVQINNLLVEVKVSDCGTGYIVDIFNNDTEDLIDTVIVMKDDLEDIEE